MEEILAGSQFASLCPYSPKSVVRLPFTALEETSIFDLGNSDGAGVSSQIHSYVSTLGRYCVQ